MSDDTLTKRLDDAALDVAHAATIDDPRALDLPALADLLCEAYAALSRMPQVVAHRDALTTPEAITAFADDLDDRLRALYFALTVYRPDVRDKYAQTLGDQRSIVGRAVRAYLGGER